MLTNSSKFVAYEECPKCHIPGRRRTLARYSDGHGYCYYCSAVEGRQYLPKLDELSNSVGKISIPSDCSRTIPTDVSKSDGGIMKGPLRWLSDYQMTRQDIILHDLMWSTAWKMLVFPYYGDDKQLIAWQGRYFNDKSKSKWYSQGKLDDLFHLCSPSERHTCKKIVLVEDIISAIKVGKIEYCMPLFTSHVTPNRMARLKHFAEELVFWYDPDARLKATRDSIMAQTYGYKTRVIVSKHDPKEHTLDEIRSYLV